MKPPRQKGRSRDPVGPIDSAASLRRARICQILLELPDKDFKKVEPLLLELHALAGGAPLSFSTLTALAGGRLVQP